MHWEKAGLVAQLDRAPRYGRGGLGFDSLQGHLKEGFQVLKLETLFYLHTIFTFFQLKVHASIHHFAQCLLGFSYAFR